MGDDARWRSRRTGAVCALVFAICALLCRPFAGVPWSDDYSYSKTALEFARSGHFVYNGWATAMLGWQVVWGGLWIRLFGFSFDVLRMSDLVLAGMCVYLFHQSLRRFGVGPRDAVIGCLALGLSPLFLPLATNFMTDVPGLFVILLCVCMCQRAAAAATDRAAIAWLVSAGLINAGGGTVRQIAWLGVLVMVPSTAWLLRRRKGILSAAAATWTSSLLIIFGCVHWFARQPYALSEAFFFWPLRLGHAKHLASQMSRAALVCSLLSLPVLAGSLSPLRRLGRAQAFRTSLILLGIGVAALLFPRQAAAAGLLVPWMIPVLASQETGVGVPGCWLQIALSMFVVAVLLVFAEQVASGAHAPAPGREEDAGTWKSMVFILGPFTLSYVLLLVPRGAMTILQDRYVLGLLPSALTLLLLLHRRYVSARLPLLSVGVLVAQAAYAIAGTHDIFADARARQAAIQQLVASGEPATAIQSGLGVDGWTQIKDGGYIHDPRVRFPVSARHGGPGSWDSPDGCRYWIEPLTPAIHPRFYVMDEPRLCPGSVIKDAARYRRWLPPFGGVVHLQVLPSRPSG